MPYSLTINFTPPTGNGYQFVNGDYRIKYWPTSSPSNVSTVFTRAFPLVLTDLNSTSYSGTIEAKCGDIYGSPRSFGPVVIAGSGGGGGGTTPACPYRVVLYEDESVSYPIGASGNTTGCAKPGYRIKLTTEGGALVTTSTALTVGVTYTVETGDCANPISVETFSTTLTIPAGSSISSGAAGTSSSCYNYHVVGNNGTNNRESIDWSYVSCAGLTINRSIVNTADTDVCARQGSISGSVDETEGTACGTVTTSGAYLQVTQANQRISSVSFSAGNPTTLVNGTLTCNLTYVGGSATLPTQNIYLNVTETTAGSSKTITWYFSNSASGPINASLPFDVKLSYEASGYGVSGGSQNVLSTIDVTSLEIASSETMQGQGTTAYNWVSVFNLEVSFRSSSSGNYNTPVTMLNSSGGYQNNPVSYTYNGTIYKINLYRNPTTAY